MSAITAPTLDRAAHLRKDLGFLETCLSDPRTLIVPMWRDQALVDDAGLVLPSLADAKDLLDVEGELVWLGYFDGKPCFALDIGSLAQPSDNRYFRSHKHTPVDLRFTAALLPFAHAELSFYARAMLVWHARHQYCSACGQPTHAREGGHVRVCSQARCATQHFPRTDPVVLALVVRGDSCLLGRQPGWPAGMHSALAGFVEPGETLEQAVVREVREEVGVELDQVRYVGSQPWPFPASLMVGFVATTRDTELRIDGNELEAARWFSRAELRALPTRDCFVPPPFSLAGRLIALFTEGRFTEGRLE